MPALGGSELQRAFVVGWDHLVVEDPVAPVDAIFCFGSRHWRVPERAAALFHAGVAPVVLITGGPAGPGEPTEAERFARDLVARGVPRGAVVLERRARHTGENVTLGLAALRSAGLHPSSLALVSWPLAARRCRATVEHLAPDVAVRSAPALRTPGARWAPTARRVRFMVGELDRLEAYGAIGHLAVQPAPPELPAATAVLRGSLAAASGPSANDAPLSSVEAAGAGSVDTEHATLLLGER